MDLKFDCILSSIFLDFNQFWLPKSGAKTEPVWGHKSSQSRLKDGSGTQNGNQNTSKINKIDFEASSNPDSDFARI